MPKKYTDRGLRIYAEFLDTYGSEVTVMESSTFEKRRCWVMCRAKNEGGGEKDFAPHLNPVQARRVARALLKFADGR